jgi:hypothetical protein
MAGKSLPAVRTRESARWKFLAAGKFHRSYRVDEVLTRTPNLKPPNTPNGTKWLDETAWLTGQKLTRPAGTRLVNHFVCFVCFVVH